MGKIEQIKLAIENSYKEESKITEECFTIGGYTTPKVRHLMNNLGAISNQYLEVGTHRGSLFIAAGYENPNLTLIAIDNFSELAEDGTVENEFLDNCNKFIKNWTLIEDDCFKVKHDMFPNKIDLYLFDGNHAYESHKLSITYFEPILANEFILVVDDANWEQVKDGTTDGINACKFEILFEQHLGAENNDYHNGIYVALIKKL
jgi:hypothetical protein